MRGAEPDRARGWAGRHRSRWPSVEGKGIRGSGGRQDLPRWREELQNMLRSGKKAEIQVVIADSSCDCLTSLAEALASIGLSELALRYLPEQVGRGRWL